MKKKAVVAVAVLISGMGVFSEKIAGQDNFDGTQLFLSRKISEEKNMDNQVWGIVNRETAAYPGLVDRSLNDETDSLGILKSSKTDYVFGMYRGGLKGASTLTYTFDVGNLTDLRLSMDWAAMGDLPAPGITVTASIDGSAPDTVFEMGYANNNPVYKMEGGRTVTAVRGAVAMVNGVKQGQILNDFATVTSKISGTGSVLTITFTMTGKGALRVYALDNLLLTGTPVQ